MGQYTCWWVGFWFLYVATDLFQGTVEHVDSLTIAFLFLNIPLQLVLAAIATLSCTAGAHRFSLAVARINTLLIATHVMISAILVWAA